MTELIRASLEPDGVLLASIDMPERTMNVFSAGLIDALDRLIERVERDPAVRSVVLTSAKPTFLAGADLQMVRGFTERARHADHAEMFELCGRLGRQFVRIEASAKPWVAAVNGIALGGGLELALACRARLVADAPRIQLGVPEVRWGLLPGAGGTQRLPRLAGFDAALDLLLSGRSIAPADAVRLGIFARAVPPATLLDEARAEARAMQGQAYAAADKFAHLAQDDVPPPERSDARAIAARHGVDGAVFDLYPAYGAIVDSVLKGAWLPLAQATAIEMHQFLRLMFNPVAGRMVGTLFLDRLRAERELAAAPALRLESFRTGALGHERQAWSDALARLKLPLAPEQDLPPDTLLLVDAQGGRHRVALRVLEELAAPADLPLAVLSPAGAYGRVIEIVGAGEASGAALAALATQLHTLPWRTPGPLSVLQRLRDRDLPEQARIALDYAGRFTDGADTFLDVAACLAGVTPAWSGGPLTWAAATPA